MPAKHLSGYYPGGYTLAAGYSRLVIDKTAYVRGSGVDVPFFATVINFGTINGGNGVLLEAGGSLINGSVNCRSASIHNGVYADGPATVANFGEIYDSYGSGVYMSAGGSLTNGSNHDTAATIFGYRDGVIFSNAAATIANFGTIIGQNDFSSGTGVVLEAGGSLINGSAKSTSALIRGIVGVTTLGAATIANFGAITGYAYDGGDGVDLHAGGLITNGSTQDSTALIEGSVGVSTVGAGTVINFGTITGLNRVSVYLYGAGSEVIAEAGSTFIGVIEGGDGTLALAGGGMGTISGLGHGGTLTGAVDGEFIHFDSVVIETGGVWTLAATNAVDAAAVLVDQGTLVNRGALAVSGTLSIESAGVFRLAGGDISAGPKHSAKIIDDGLLIKSFGTGKISVAAHTFDDGVVEVATGTLDFTSHLLGAGVLKIDSGATLEADAAAVSTLTTTFDGDAATLALETPNAFHATLSDFAAGDTVDLLTIKATGASVNASDQLVIVDGVRTVASLQLSGDYAGATFSTASDGQGGTSVMLASDGPDLPSVAGMASAMASLAAPAGVMVLGHGLRAGYQPMLARPNVHLE